MDTNGLTAMIPSGVYPSGIHCGFKTEIKGLGIDIRCSGCGRFYTKQSYGAPCIVTKRILRQNSAIICNSGCKHLAATE